MSKHPLNLAFRFSLEMAALLIFGFWGWESRTDWLRYILTGGLPLAAAAIWGAFRVPGDPGNALVPIPGWLRLSLEALFFSLATLSLFNISTGAIAWIFGGCVLLHYGISYDRITWLVKQGKSKQTQ
jgi:hypothetical protein